MDSNNSQLAKIAPMQYASNNFTIDLIAKYRDSDITTKFDNFKQKIVGFKNSNDEYDLKTGDSILFYNGYDVQMTGIILGFDTANGAFILWDCYWAQIPLKTRFISKLS